MFENYIIIGNEQRIYQFSCSKLTHNNNRIERCCLRYGCNKSRKICYFCLPDHEDHLLDCMKLCFLEKIFENEESKLMRLMEKIKALQLIQSIEVQTIIGKISSQLNYVKQHKIYFIQDQFIQFEQILIAAAKCYSNIFYSEQLNIIYSQYWPNDQIINKINIIQLLEKNDEEDNLDYLVDLLEQKGIEQYIRGCTLNIFNKLKDAKKMFQTIHSVKPTFMSWLNSWVDLLNQNPQLDKISKNFLRANLNSDLILDFMFYSFSSNELIIFYLASLFYKEKQYQRSLNLINQIQEDQLKDHPLEMKFRILISSNLFYLEHYDQALIQCELGLKISSNNQNLLIIQSACLAEINKNCQKLFSIQNVNNDNDFILLKQSEYLFKQVRIKEAFKLLDQIKTNKNIYNIAQFLKVETLLNLNENEKALECLQRVQGIEANQSYVQTLMQLCRCSQPIESLQLINEQLQKDYNQPHLFKRKSLILFQLGKFNEALECIEVAIKQFPKMVEFYYSKIFVLTSLEKLDEALLVTEEMIKSEKDQFFWLRVKGTLLYMLRRTNESIKIYNQICSKYNQMIEGYFDKGVLLMDQKQYREALTEFNKVIQIDFQYIPAHYNKGQKTVKSIGLALFMLEEDQEAIKIFQTVDFNKSKLLLIQILMLNKEFSKALQVIEQQQSSQKHIERLFIFLYTILMQQTQYQLAFEAIKNVKKNKLVWHILFLVEPLIKDNKFDQAQLLINQQLQEDSNNFYALVTQGDLLREQGMYQQALSSYNKAFSLQNDSPMKQIINQIMNLYLDSKAIEQTVNQIKENIINEFKIYSELYITPSCYFESLPLLFPKKIK